MAPDRRRGKKNCFENKAQKERDNGIRQNFISNVFEGILSNPRSNPIKDILIVKITLNHFLITTAILA
jgi:hypothetical protein